MGVYIFTTIIGLVFFFLSGALILREREVQKRSDLRVVFGDGVEFNVTEDGKFHVELGFDGYFVKSHFLRPRIEFLNEKGQSFKPNLWSSGHSVWKGKVSYSIGSLKLAKGIYKIRAAEKDIERFRSLNAEIALTQSSLLLFVVAIFMFVLPSILCLILGIAVLFK